jgi:hypothetical protein
MLPRHWVAGYPKGVRVRGGCRFRFTPVFLSAKAIGFTTLLFKRRDCPNVERDEHDAVL